MATKRCKEQYQCAQMAIEQIKILSITYKKDKTYNHTPFYYCLGKPCKINHYVSNYETDVIPNAIQQWLILHTWKWKK